LKWSITLMIVGILIIAIGFIPPYFGGLSINTLETTASLFSVGLLIFLVGLFIRRARKAFRTTFSNPKS
jgi:uncharacterized membrane protein YtjA (UPF0391 family)